MNLGSNDDYNDALIQNMHKFYPSFSEATDVEWDHLRHLADNNAMFKRDEAQDEKRVAYLLSINVLVEWTIFKNRPIR